MRNFATTIFGDWQSGWAGPAIVLLMTSMWLLFVGTIFVHSAADGPIGAFPGPYVISHIKKIILGICCLATVSILAPRKFDHFAPLFFWGIVSVLVLLFMWKLMQGGVVRWVRIGGFGFQPSELAKIATVLFLARILRPQSDEAGWKPLVRAFSLASIPFLLIALQPDLGTALVLVPTVAAMIWVSGISRKRFVLLVLIACVIAGCAWPLLHDYQKDRVLAYLGIGEVSRETAGGYQVAQSIIAIGSGGPGGKGLHLGSHHDLGYLPEDHNDFIFAVIGEEWGLVGTISVLVGFLVLIFAMLGVAWNCRDPFGRLVAVGIATQIGFQALVNQAMTVGLVPVTGLPLPFISYGGTSIVVSLAAVGIVISISRKPVEVIHPDGLKKGTSEIRNRPLRSRVSKIEG
ncbi:MAG: FtsW/RodA/SpoVE family cell cycle protein [Planctomycetota bacterium]|nr:FtsW/RodA/SpoVE family cell cycle protein [Planctomycetota bacterium]